MSRAARVCSVRAEASNSEQASGVDLEGSRRGVLGAGLALATASVLPLAAPRAASANKLLSGDWEQVREKGSIAQLRRRLLARGCAREGRASTHNKTHLRVGCVWCAAARKHV